MTRGRRIGLAVAVLVVLLPLAAGVAFWALFDADALKTRLADAVRRSTGRELVIAGPVGLTWSLIPTVAVSDVSLSNPSGMSRPAMARMTRVEARVALLPLLSRRIEVRGINLVEPDILLERDAAGRPNWTFTPVAPPQATPAPQGAAGSHMQVLSVDAIRIRDGRVGWRQGAEAFTLTMPTFAAVAAGPGAPVALSGTLAVQGLGLELKGTTGPLATIDAGTWPLQAALEGSGLQGRVDGTVGPEGVMALSASMADLAVLAPVLGRAPPPLRDMQLSARLTPAGVSDIQGQAGAADLSAWLPGLRLTRMALSAPAMAQPVRFTAEGLAGTAPVALAANAGTLAALLGGGPVPVQVLLTAAGATVSAQGAIADLTGRGLDVGLAAWVPDLRALGAVAGVALPALRDIAFDAQASMADAGAVALRAMRLTMPPGDISGDVVLGRMPRPSVRGTLVSQRLDIDAFSIGASRPVPTGAALPGPASPPAAPSPSTRVLSDAPLPFDMLRRADADVQFRLNEVVWRGASYHAAAGRLLLQDGRLRLDPVQAQAPGGAIQARVLADASAAVPTVALGLHAPGMDAGPLLAAFGAPDITAGRLDADIQVKGAGASVRAIAASLDGHVGLAMVDGELDNRWLAGLLGEALRALPVDLKGRSVVRCLAVRFDVASGQATTRALLLDASRVRFEGEGGMNLADETLDLRLRPLVHLGATSVAVPVHLTGPWRSPRPQVQMSGAGQGALVIGATPGPDACPAQLALARDGKPGAMPAAASTPPEALRLPKPADLLRSLLR